MADQDDPYEGLGGFIPELKKKLDELDVGYSVPFRGVSRANAIVMAELMGRSTAEMMRTWVAIAKEIAVRPGGKEWLRTKGVEHIHEAATERAEDARIRDMIDLAARATDVFSEDELEKYANSIRKEGS